MKTDRIRTSLRTLVGRLGWWLVEKSKPTYALIYDEQGQNEDEPGEHYYGYFSGNAEAEEVFGTFVGPEPGRYSNVFLCAIKQPMPGFKSWMAPR
ncbi:hypothetical protein [Croceicoccus gelatinilyticus]|uniref:hypothetical protein n=1 Tax=Croceicoccus gelatinilyticus TaxID=2835536 RepID=UPI001BCC1963|nr:hypothetical protein [Croceicoccus gelatinilyticus]MBS7671413.1 hypothetical protein [Croceicoccus gelatinilyticus]